MEIRPGVVVSAVGHAAILAWGLISFSSATPLDMSAIEAVPVDLVPLDERTDLSQGLRTAAIQPQPAPNDPSRQEAERPTPDPGRPREAAIPPPPQARQPEPPAPEPPAPQPEAAVPPPPEPAPEPPHTPDPPAEAAAVVEQPPPPEPPPEAEPAAEAVATPPEPAPTPTPPVPEEQPVAAIPAPQVPVPRARPRPPPRPPREPEPPAPQEQQVAAAEPPAAPDRATPQEDAPTPPEDIPSDAQTRDFDADQIAALLNQSQPAGQAPSEQTAALGAQNDRQTAAMTASELDALRAKIRDCWFPPLGWTDPAEVRVVVRMTLNQDGTLLGAPSVVEAPAGRYSRRAPESALTALRRCAPYELPPEKYDAWREVEIRFDPIDMYR